MTAQSSPAIFADRHIGARRQSDIDTMLKAVGYDSGDGLVDSAVPDSIRIDGPLSLGDARSETEVLAELRELVAKNKTVVQMIGQGYYDTITPPIIRRNVLEAPAWYTAYHPVSARDLAGQGLKRFVLRLPEGFVAEIGEFHGFSVVFCA